jgi:hypothetical protein
MPTSFQWLKFGRCAGEIKELCEAQKEVVNRIIEADTLTAVLGYWPSFHDAEVKYIKLDR